MQPRIHYQKVLGIERGVNSFAAWALSQVAPVHISTPYMSRLLKAGGAQIARQPVACSA